MLKRLYIKNLAIIEESEIELGSGLNILTGETGSGKSLIFQAINLALGKRASFDLIRNGESKCIIEVEFDGFDAEKIINVLQDSELYSIDKVLIIRKEINSNGVSRSFLNDSPIQLQELKQIAGLLYDHHGQLQTTNLMESEYQLLLIDDLSEHTEFIEQFNIDYNLFQQSVKYLNSVISSAEKLKRDRDYWEFQLKEIQKVNPQPNEEVDIENEIKVLENAEFLFNLSNEIIDDLYDKEENVYSVISRSLKSLKQINNIDSQFSTQYDELNSALIIIEETHRNLANYKSNIEFNPDKIEDFRNRWSELNMLSKKFGSIQNAIDLKVELQNNLKLVDNFDEELHKLMLEVEEKRSLLAISAMALSNSRIKNSKDISEKLNIELQELGLEQSIIDIRVKQSEDISANNFIYSGSKKIKLSETGIDEVEFMISTNKGESMKSMSDIASGGEMSRIMLAIKSLSRDKKKVQTLLLDEIDTGISGRIAQKVGKYMKKISGNVQILAITHLPQIAANSDLHFQIEKKEESERTFSRIKLLNENEKLEEIAKLFSGETLTETSIINARQLVEQV
jgi:DNA repair protein RecN (Recombination protein N)